MGININNHFMCTSTKGGKLPLLIEEASLETLLLKGVFRKPIKILFV